VHRTAVIRIGRARDLLCQALDEKVTIAQAAREAGLDDYKVLVNVGPGAGQTVFHLHWHILGGRLRGLPE
jgi:histidine triad (HIT) family protein